MENNYHYNHRVEIPQRLSKSTKNPSTQFIEDNRAYHKQTSELIRSICKSNTITAVRQMRWDFERKSSIKNEKYRITVVEGKKYSITKLNSSEALTEDEMKEAINDLRKHSPKGDIILLDPVLQSLIMYDADKLKATSENAFGYGSIYFESKRDKGSDMQRIRLLHNLQDDHPGPSLGHFHTDVRWYSTTGGGIGNSTKEPHTTTETPGITNQYPTIEQQNEVSLKEFFGNSANVEDNHTSRGHIHDLSMPGHEGLNQDGIDEIVKLISEVENINFEGGTKEKKLEAKNKYTMKKIRELIDARKLPEAYGQELAFAAISEKTDENYESVPLDPLELQCGNLIEVYEKQKKYYYDRVEAKSASSVLLNKVSDLDTKTETEMQNYKNSRDWKDKLKTAFCCLLEVEDRIINDNSVIAAQYDKVAPSIPPLKDKINSHFWPFVNNQIRTIEARIEEQKAHKLTNLTWSTALRITGSIKIIAGSINDALAKSTPNEIQSQINVVDDMISVYNDTIFHVEKDRKCAIWDLAQAYKQFSKYL